ncbi:PadR family transcriptional regulator [Fodinicola feengrottensis]|uniref:PadR family transcriptional regulator n=1 Tax=Fodinicola feengrottensis TaxID=435914 RepID=A0ABP4TUW2_9ACTN
MTPAIFALLLALAGGEQHGYALMSDVEALTGGLIRLGPGTLYRSLQRMRVDGLIVEIEDTNDSGHIDGDSYDRRGERRRSYRLTDRGREAAAEEAGRLSVLVAAAESRGIRALETRTDHTERHAG